MVHKTRKAMGNLDDKYTLEGMIEMDERYFSVEASETQKADNKRGKGAIGKQNVADVAESKEVVYTTTGFKSKQ